MQPSVPLLHVLHEHLLPLALGEARLPHLVGLLAPMDVTSPYCDQPRVLALANARMRTPRPYS